MGSYDRGTRKLVLSNADGDAVTSSFQALTEYARDSDGAFAIRSNSGLQREIYRAGKLKEYIAHPELAMEHRETRLKAIDAKIDEMYDDTLRDYLACGIPVKEARAKATALATDFIRARLDMMDATEPSDIFRTATEAAVVTSEPMKKIKTATKLLKQ